MSYLGLLEEAGMIRFMSLSVVFGLGVVIGLTTSEPEVGAAETNSGSSDMFRSFAASWSMLSICKSLLVDEVTFSNVKLFIF